MDPARFDSIAKSLARPVSRRQVMRGALAAAAGMLLGRGANAAQPAGCPTGLASCDGRCVDLQSDRMHCGRCHQQCVDGRACISGECRQVTCDALSITCWDNTIDPRTDRNNCGQCGEVCAPRSACVDCACTAPELLDGEVCRSRFLKLWASAFVPGFMEGAEMATVDGMRRAVVRLPWPDADEDAGANGPDLFLLADRDPDQRFAGPPFSTDLNAPSVGRVEFDLTLPDMIPTTPVMTGGTVVAVASDGAGGFTTLCERIVKAPDAACFRRQATEESTEIAYAVDCRWTVQTGAPSDPICPIDAWVPPPIRLEGRVEVGRIDDDRLVEVRFLRPGTPPTNGRVSAFPAFEMYATLDDGNRVPIFQYQPPDPVWQIGSLVPVVDELGQQCGEDECNGVVARLGCGCGTSCIDRQDCVVGELGVTCSWLDSYFVLAGSNVFDPTNDIVCSDPRCPADVNCVDACREGYITADGGIMVAVDGRTIYRSDAYGKQIVPPIGFEAAPNSVITITGPDTQNTRFGLNQLYLHRIDGPHGLRQTQVPPAGGNAIAVSGEKQVATRIPIGLARTNRSSTICCRDGDEQVCVDRMASKRHCGGCDQPCPEGMLCLGGNCICPHPATRIGDQCVDLTQNDMACGPKQENCAVDGRFCAQSSCVHPDCRDTANFQVCDGVCVTRDSTVACGASCVPCHVPQQGSAICVPNGDDRICDIQCPDDVLFQRCGNECYERTDALHCGASCVDCGPTENGSSICRPSADDPERYECGVACFDGFHECGGRCVANDSILSCGSSCEPCDPWMTVCVNGVCCWDAAAVCPDGCVDIFQDMNNCGSCGAVCTKDCCFAGGCYSNGESCGQCGIVCGGGQICDPNTLVCVDPAAPITCRECESLVGGECQLNDGFTIIGGMCVPIVISEPIGGN